MKTMIITSEPQINVVVNPVFGSDPELFVWSDEMETIVPVLGLLGGTKKNPKPLESPGFFVQEDNVLAEFNIPPADSKEKFIAAIHNGIAMVADAMPRGFVPVVKTSHRFYPFALEDPRAKEFGCDPDFNAWRDEEVPNEAPDTSGDETLRVAGGHLSTGYNDPNKETNKLLVRLYDAYLGVPSVVLDSDTDRRKLYGKAGSYRNKNFGVEYRTLSSFWIGSPELTGWVWDRAMQAIEHLNRGDFSALDYEAFIIDTINTGNVSNAKKFIKEYNIPMP